MARRAALVLTPRLPWPLDDGGRIVLWQGLWAASRDHDVTLVSFVPPGTEREPLPDELRAVTARIVRVPHRPPSLPVAAVRGLVGRWPYTLARYQSAEFAGAVRGAVAADRPAYVFVNHLHLAPYFESLAGVPMILREHNVEHAWMHRRSRSLGPTLTGLYARVQANRLRSVERDSCERAALTLAIQEGEADALRALAPKARIRTVPVGVNLGRFHEPSPALPPTVLLPGSFAWEPNVEGALRFLSEGWPQVSAAVPAARLRIAGKAPPSRLRDAAARGGVTLMPDIPSMEDEFAAATVVVVPLWVGAGARVKVVEAMAARVPVVATPLAVEGLGLEPELHYACGDTGADLGEQVAALLRDRDERVRLAATGRALAEARWSLDVVARLQNSLVAEALA
ncbi:MAG TPA: glycosyltransferase family 4 protein [Candidatus Eisenbacteria bacterium]|nr:glycosyltransferase family 4 protein [Candidatus Eisenbacteria bacterium]